MSGIYRGPGGTGDATGDAVNQASIAIAAANSASASATAAAASATTASTAASSTAGSVTAAANSATAAATSATNAATSATTATTQATAAASSATAASGSATTATTQATNASNSATAAATSATNAASSATSASGSASTATTQASNASTSATNASNSASAASTSATNAANSATAAAASATTAASYTPSQTGNAGKFLTTNGTNTSWGSTATVTSVATGTGLTGGPITTSGTIAIDSTVATLTGSQTLTNKTLTTPTIDKIVTSVSNTSLGAGNASLMKNRIINGAMVIDQRNSGASVTATGSNYCLDRWQMLASVTSKFTVQQNAGSVTPPVGFSNYLGVTSSSAYSVGATDYFTVTQKIEGFNSADLGWGTANAKPITISFQAYSSLTGTFGFVVRNSAGSRVYPASYSIPVANTWTTISVTIAGDTTGTWIGSTNGIGLELDFGLGVGSTYSNTAGTWTTGGLGTTGAVSVVGTNAATWYVTGVQLELGSVNTGFEYRDYPAELAKCQRYYELFGNGGVGSSNSGNAAAQAGSFKFSVPKRATPTITHIGNYTLWVPNVGGYVASASGISTASTTGCMLGITVSPTPSTTGLSMLYNTSTDNLGAAAEL